MNILFYKGTDQEPYDTAKDDGETVEFETGPVVNCDIENGFVTLYTDNRHWYVVLDEHDITTLLVQMGLLRSQ